MQETSNNEILEVGQIIVVYRNDNNVRCKNSSSDGYAILRKKLYENHNRQVWSIWWSTINEETCASVVQPKPLKPIQPE